MKRTRRMNLLSRIRSIKQTIETFKQSPTFAALTGPSAFLQAYERDLRRARAELRRMS